MPLCVFDEFFQVPSPDCPFNCPSKLYPSEVVPTVAVNFPSELTFPFRFDWIGGLVTIAVPVTMPLSEIVASQVPDTSPVKVPLQFPAKSKGLESSSSLEHEETLKNNAAKTNPIIR